MGQLCHQLWVEKGLCFLDFSPRVRRNQRKRNSTSVNRSKGCWLKTVVHRAELSEQTENFLRGHPCNSKSARVLSRHLRLLLIFDLLELTGWQKLCEGTKGLRRKVRTCTKIVAILRFVAIYPLFGNLWAIKCLLGQKQCFLGKR